MKGGKGEQLQMFMPAKDLVARVGMSYDQKKKEDLSQMWDRKLAESKAPATDKLHDVQWRGGRGHRVTIAEYPSATHGAGVHDSLRTKGFVGKAIPVRHGDFPGSETRNDGLRLEDGHHRVAAAADLDILIPVEHSDANSDNVAYKGRMHQQRRYERPQT